MFEKLMQCNRRLGKTTHMIEMAISHATVQDVTVYILGYDLFHLNNLKKIFEERFKDRNMTDKERNIVRQNIKFQTVQTHNSLIGKIVK